jgi:hypothetical protein
MSTRPGLICAPLAVAAMVAMMVQRIMRVPHVSAVGLNSIEASSSTWYGEAVSDHCFQQAERGQLARCCDERADSDEDSISQTVRSAPDRCAEL